MTLAIDKIPMTVEQFVNLPDSQDYELIDGNLVERKKVGARSSFIATKITGAVDRINEDNHLGWTFDSETIYRCFGPGQTGRRFDFSFIRRGRLIGERIPDGDIQIPPDFAVEVVSPNDLAYDVADKVALYLQAGIGLVWIVYPEQRSIEAVRPDRSATYFGPDEEITGESVLPGFKAKAGKFFPPLENAETTGDAVR